MTNHLQKYFLCIFIALTSLLNGQTAPVPVVFKKDTLFSINSNIGTFSAQIRAEMVLKNVRGLSKLPPEEFDSLRVITNLGSADIVQRGEVIASVTLADAKVENQSMTVLAEAHRETIRQALLDDYNDTSVGNLAEDFGLFILALLGFLLVFWTVNKTFDYFRKNLKTLQRNIFFKDNRFIRTFTLITPETERKILLFILRMARFTAIGSFLYFYLPFMFSQISYTRGFGERLMEYVLRPLEFLAKGFIDFLPSLLFILVICVAANYLIGGMRYIALQVKSERIKVGGFFPDWAYPTFNLFRVLIIIFTLVIVFPYLPGSGSDAFQGVSVFVGLLLSLGSAGVIGNVISGIVLTYMRPFTVGDRVKIGDTMGDVISKNLLVTRIRTTKNEEITIPNGTLMGGGVVNYSSMAHEHGLVLHTSITIGYDVPWTQVHELLIDAAGRTLDTEKEPRPFVLQKALNDWYVEYELNVYTHTSHKMPRIYSDLHANIQDTFNEAGVEIMSSHYMAVRDGNQVAMPERFRSKLDVKTSTNSLPE